MKFTALVAMIDPTFYVPISQTAERLGFSAVSVPDSICYPLATESKYPYTSDGSRAFLENKPFVEPLIAVAAMAASTSTIQFHTDVLKLPIRQPVIFSKSLTSLAVMTGNRFKLGIGTSPWPDDYEIVDLPWSGRGRRFDECITIIRGLSSGEYFEFHGEFYDFPAIKMSPVPAEPIKLIVGGHSEAHIHRAARIADGWTTAGMSTDQIASTVQRLNLLRSEQGRENTPFEVYATNVDSMSVDGVKRLEEAGVTHTCGGFTEFRHYGLEADTEPLQVKLDALSRYADEVIARVTP